MKRKTTEKILAESFREIAAQKDVRKITINDIVNNCGLSPATFYRHFRDKYDLIAWMYGQRCDEIIHRFDNSPHKREAIVTAWVNFCRENKEFLVNLFNNTSGYDSFLPKMAAKHVQLTEHAIIARAGLDAITEKDHLKIYMYFYGLALFICNWLMGKIDAAQDELIEMILETLPM